MLCVSIWGFFYGLELSSQTLEQMLFWGKLQYLGIAFAPACWLYFCLKYTDYKIEEKKALIYSIFILPVITVIAVWTNEYHSLHYIGFELNPDSPFPLISLEPGVWYYINVTYSYILFSIGILVLIKRAEFADPAFKAQTRVIMIAGIFPLFFNLLYQTRLIVPYNGIDLTTYAFLFTYIVLGVAILKYNLFSIKPIARDKVVEALTNGVLVLDDSNRVVDFNPAMNQFNPKEKSLQSSFDTHRIFERHPEIIELVESKSTQKIRTDLEVNGTKKTVQIQSIPLTNKNLSISGKVLIFDDITHEVEITEQLKSQTEDLQQLNDLKDKFFSIISHDLKGPVFGVAELIHLTQTGVVSKEEFVEMLPEISKNMTNVSVLLENLLAWSSSQLRGEQRFPEDFDISKSLQNQGELLARIASEKEISIVHESDSEVWVFADKNMIDLVLRNLINNGIKFSKPKGEIKISCKLAQDKVEICVQDFGTGISPENLEKLRHGISFTTKGESNESGTGLGLVLVREYLKKNHGSLSIQSEQGKGSKFCIEFPASQRNRSREIPTAELGNS